MVKQPPLNNLDFDTILAPADIPKEEDTQSLREALNFSDVGGEILLEHVKNEKSTRALRETTAKMAFIYLCALSLSVFLLVLFHGFRVFSFQLDTIVLTTLSGGTFISAIGMFGLVVKGLFPAPNLEKRPKEQRSSLAKKRN